MMKTHSKIQECHYVQLKQATSFDEVKIKLAIWGIKLPLSQSSTFSFLYALSDSQIPQKEKLLKQISHDSRICTIGWWFTDRVMKLKNAARNVFWQGLTPNMKTTMSILEYACEAYLDTLPPY